jgi:methylmalonyl-CoA epimerase
VQINRIDHIGIAVSSLDKALKFYAETMGLKLQGIEILNEHGVRTAIIRVGESKIELLEPTSPDSPIAKFIEKKGEGLHHLALEVPNVKEAIAEYQAKGVNLIDKVPRTGAENTSIAFVHPKDSVVLLELVENRH